MRILIVDDSPEFLMLAQAVLERVGHHVISRETAPTGDLECDIVLADLNLNEGNGIDFLEKVRSQNAHRKLVLISATNISPELQRRLKVINAQFAAKPLSPMKLISLIGQRE